MQNNEKISSGTIARTVVLALALVNQLLVIFGKGTIDITDNTIYTIVSEVAMVGSAIWAWWKNNSFTKAARVADGVLNDLKSNDMASTLDGEVDV